MGYIDRSERLWYTTIETQVCELMFGPVPFCTFSMIEDEKLSRKKTLGLWVRLVPFGRRVTWKNQWILTGISNEEQTSKKLVNRRTNSHCNSRLSC